MHTERLPRWTLRQEVLEVLGLYYQTADESRFLPLPPMGVLALLNQVGPTLGEECVPLIEMMLDGLYDQGLVGRIPAPTPRHAKSYLSREAAEAAIGAGIPVILLPLAESTPAPIQNQR
jgi:hypothetical protein